MAPYKKQLFMNVSMISDIATLLLTLVLMILTRIFLLSTNPSLHKFIVIWLKTRNIIILALLFMTWHIFFQLLGFYKSRMDTKSHEILDIFKLSATATFVLLLFSNLFTITTANKLFIVIFWVLSFTLLLSTRSFIRIYLKRSNVKGIHTTQILIIGTGKIAIELAEKLYNNPALGFRLVGFVDDHWDGLNKLDKKKYDLLGNIDNLHDILRNEIIDEAIISLPVKSYYDKISSIINLCEEQGIVVRLTADFFDLKIARSFIDNFNKIPILTLHSTPIDQIPLLTKRLIDIIFSASILILISPLLLIISLLIKLDSKGPIIFTQERVGLNKRRFKLLKFRTMVVNAEELKSTIEKNNEATGPVFKIKNDPRLTGLGKWLRKASIDELPQLFNVLRGEMSLVGPRPPIMSEVNQYEWKNRRRLSMKPGITCLWQVSGRSDIPFERWMELDMEYIDNWSLMLDFKLMIKTIPAVLKGTGAS